MEIEVIRSPRRHKSVQAREVDGVLRVSIPATMTPAEEAHWVAEMQRKVARSRSAGRVDLDARARELAARHGLPRPASIRWVGNQAQRWGSCTPQDRAVRLSDRMARFPAWVIDYVVVHELAHLVHPDHSPAFWSLVARYPLAERARGYLIAKDLDRDD